MGCAFIALLISLLAHLAQEGAAASSTLIKVSSTEGLTCTQVCLDAQNGGVSYSRCTRGLNAFGAIVECSSPIVASAAPYSCQCKNPVTAGGSGSASCTSIHRACTTCSRRRLPGSSKTGLVCTGCASGWRLRPDGLAQTCDCYPGFHMNGTVSAFNSWCITCQKPQYCPGGDVTNNPQSLAYNCQAGLGTLMDGAKSIMQCTTIAGFGRSTTLGADGTTIITNVFQCPVGSWNPGGNTGSCVNCPAGLTTIAPGASNVTQCVAPPGSYLDRGIGKLCPKGTYQPDYNTLTSCISCSTGMTTVGEGHNSSTDCTLAMLGYYLVDANTAAQCPQDSYNDQEAAISQCTSCPLGYKTQAPGATGAALCLAPPGFELLAGADRISECPLNWYKEGWNRNPCVQCGDGLMTATTGSVSRDDCGVPPGYGVVRLAPLEAEMCTNNRYGMNVTRPAIASSVCQTCPPGMYTRDVLTGVEATAGYTSFRDCLVKPGYGVAAGGMVMICEPGTYNPGLNQEPCTACAAGYTTDPDIEGATSMQACRVVPGWVVSSAFGVPQPCDKGTFSIGGTEEDPHPSTCTKCPDGFTTQEDESIAPEDCSYCIAGHGGTDCTHCPYDTFSSGGHEAGQACMACPTNHVSARRSTDGDHCVADLEAADNDYFPLNNESAWTADGAATTKEECKQACRTDTRCAMFRFATSAAANGDKCHLLLERLGGPNTWGFKVPTRESDYALYQFDGSLRAGLLTENAGAKTAKECVAACSRTKNCELFVIQTSSMTDPDAASPCELYRSDLDSEWSSSYHIQGNRLYSDVLIPGASFPTAQPPIPGRRMLRAA